MQSDQSSSSSADGEAAPLVGAGEPDLVRAAISHLRRGAPGDGGPSEAPPVARQKADLREWAEGAGLLLTPDRLPGIPLRGGQEHDLFHHEATDRYFKVTRNGVFGLSPGIELALVSSDQDGRRFQLWEATPLEYLERLALHNELVPDLNRLEGVLFQEDGDMAIVISQPRFDIMPMTEAEIDAWFAGQGFRRIAQAAYYRREDNLGVFDAHDKNVIRAGDTLVPFDVIPCHPAAGFQEFIEDCLAAGHTLAAMRTISPSPRRESLERGGRSTKRPQG